MGFDLYGTNPKNPKNLVKPQINWDKKTTEEERKKYFAEIEKYEEEVIGHYFRNNVWWWRPLATTIIECNDWLTEEQKKGLSYNDGFEFDETEAETIRKSLQEKLDNGYFKKLQKEWNLRMQKAEVWNAKLEQEMDKVKKEAEKILGKTNVAPIDFPAPYKEKWDKLYENKDYNDSYPFSVKNIQEFCKFLENCGGFKVC